jgi:carboxyl-terminal processing protease
MKRRLRTFAISVSLFVFTSIVFSAGVVFGSSGLLFAPEIARAADQPVEFAVFWQAWNIIQAHFVDREAVDPTQLTYGAIRGLVETLGDEGHTRFLTPEEANLHDSSVSGTFSGIGVRLRIEDEQAVISTVFTNSPADWAGVQAGDVIVAVDGSDVGGWQLGQLIGQVRGEAGTEVLLTVFRPGLDQRLEISIIRGEVNVPAATWAMVPGTGVAVLNISQFGDNLNHEVVAALEEARAAGATRLVVDVRDNPGGLLQQAIKLTSQFLEDGDVVLEEDAAGNHEAYPVQGEPLAADLPLVVLTNEGTASAAEIFAGAIQDHDRGLVVGQTTFGTGTILQPFRLEDGSVLLLGTRQWRTPTGRLIRKRGLEPDIAVPLSIEAQIVSPGALEALTPVEVWQSGDTQLLTALRLLGVYPRPSLELERLDRVEF